MENPKNDMAFLLIAPSVAVGCKTVFGLLAVWVHPCQTHLVSLAEVAQCLFLLANEGPDCPYTFIQMNYAILHVLLFSKGHLGILMEGKPQMNPSAFHHQLQAWKLLQCGKWVACPGGLNVGLKALVFDFEELLLWNVSTVGEATWDPSVTEMDPCCMRPKAITATPAPPIFSAVEPQPSIT